MTSASGAPSYTTLLKTPANGVFETRAYVNDPSLISFYHFNSSIKFLRIYLFVTSSSFFAAAICTHADSSSVEAANVLILCKVLACS